MSRLWCSFTADAHTKDVYTRHIHVRCDSLTKKQDRSAASHGTARDGFC